MVDLKARQEENDRINRELNSLPEAPKIQYLSGYIKGKQAKILNLKEEIARLNTQIADEEKEITESEASVHKLLTSVEEKSGYSKMPLGDYGTVYLREVKEGYDITDNNAVPALYIEQVMTAKVIRKKISDDLKAGKLVENNWLKIRPAYKTVVITS